MNESIRNVLRPKTDEQILEQVPEHHRELVSACYDVFLRYTDTPGLEHDGGLGFTHNVSKAMHEPFFGFSFHYDLKQYVLGYFFNAGDVFMVFIPDLEGYDMVTTSEEQFETTLKAIISKKDRSHGEVNEAIGDLLKGKTVTEIEPHLRKLDVMTMLYRSVEMGYHKGVEEALKKYAKSPKRYESKHPSAERILGYMIKKGDIESVKLFIEYVGVSLIRHRDWLSVAIEKDQYDMMKFLREQGAYVSTMAVMHAAAKPKKYIEFVVANGGDVNERAWNRLHTPLMEAALHRNLEVVKFLVENGASVKAHGSAALIKACSVDENFEVVKYLVEHGATVNTTKKKTPLLIAVQTGLGSGDTRVVEYLIDNGADVKRVDYSMFLHAMSYVSPRSAPIKELLLGIVLGDPNAPENVLMDALAHTVSQRNVPMAKRIIRHLKLHESAGRGLNEAIGDVLKGKPPHVILQNVNVGLLCECMGFVESSPDWEIVGEMGFRGEFDEPSYGFRFRSIRKIGGNHYLSRYHTGERVKFSVAHFFHENPNNEIEIILDNNGWCGKLESYDEFVDVMHEDAMALAKNEEINESISLESHVNVNEGFIEGFIKDWKTKAYDADKEAAPNFSGRFRLFDNVSLDRKDRVVVTMASPLPKGLDAQRYVKHVFKKAGLFQFFSRFRPSADGKDRVYGHVKPKHLHLFKPGAGLDESLGDVFRAKDKSLIIEELKKMFPVFVSIVGELFPGEPFQFDLTSMPSVYVAIKENEKLYLLSHFETSAKTGQLPKLNVAVEKGGYNVFKMLGYVSNADEVRELIKRDQHTTT